MAIQTGRIINCLVTYLLYKTMSGSHMCSDGTWSVYDNNNNIKEKLSYI